MNLQGEPLRVGRLVHAEQCDVSPEAIQFYCDTFEDRHPAYASAAPGGPIAPPLLFHSEVYRHASWDRIDPGRSRWQHRKRNLSDFRRHL